MTPSNSIKSVRTAFDIIQLLSASGNLTATKIADELEMNRSTVHDYLRTLTEEGYVINTNGEYCLSHQFLNLGGNLRKRNELFRTARPVLRDLATSKGAPVVLTIEERGYGVVLYTVSGENMQNALTHEGTHFLLHSAAPGKAILAHSPEEKVENIIESRGLVAVTDQTITDEDELQSELTDIRNQEYAVDHEEIGIGLQGIGTAITDSESGEVTGAISMYVPAKNSHQKDIIDSLLEAANVIEVELHYQ
ncbi:MULTISPECIES: IclR family transcriptional regulator [Halobacteriales]|jgi:IclR family acetate operon transcriptional repressor|uniref:IclR family transcriptional regulator n=1 Tax=Halobacteriales TaxID=2235 RepID=UPI001FF686CE|nr:MULTISPECIES: IclR family transcriptional regulator [Haloarculaceae]